MKRGEIWWAELPDPVGSEPGYARPVVIISADRFNATAIDTVTVVYLYANLAVGRHPGNVTLLSRDTGLDRDSVANVTQLGTIDKQHVQRRIGAVPPTRLRDFDDGLRLALQL